MFENKFLTLFEIMQEAAFSGNRYRALIHQAGRGRTDWIQPICIFVLCVMGVFFIYSAQVYSGQSQWIRQAVWIVLGAGVYIAVSLLDYKILLEKAHLIYFGSVGLLLLLWTPLGDERFNALRWLDFGVASFQPSEAAKIGVLVMVSSMLARSEVGTVRESLTVLLLVGIVVLVPILLIFFQPDLGSALVIPPMVFSLLYVSKLSKRFFTAAFAVFALLLAALAVDLYRYLQFLQVNQLSAYDNRGEYEKHSWIPLKDYQRNRILTQFVPDAIDPRGIGVSWNQRQSLLSVGSGGLIGKGWSEGTQAKLGYLPQSVAHNDFIFAVLAEEKGYLGSMSVVFLFALIVFNGVRIAGVARDRFGMLLSIGVSVIFIVHIYINIGMTINLMPITGLPLPFLSYGGSFILSCCLLQGLVQSVYRCRREFS